MSASIKKEILKCMEELKKINISELPSLRYDKFRNMGEYFEK